MLCGAHGVLNCPTPTHTMHTGDQKSIEAHLREALALTEMRWNNRRERDGPRMLRECFDWGWLYCFSAANYHASKQMPHRNACIRMLSRVCCHVYAVPCMLSRVCCHVYAVPCMLSRLCCHVYAVTCMLSRVCCHVYAVTCMPSRV